ncbi:MAG: hypothetical protein HZA15_06535 [Nitrospirae bacterium]|nr:hypothetical protein [Nitrospirota bacterium]
MAWNCPECKKPNESSSKRCSCGYAYYEVLGLKEDAPAQSVEQTYKYLSKVWGTPAETHAAGARGKLDKRVKKINDAYDVFRQISRGADNGTKNPHIIRIAVGGGAALLVLLAIIFLFSSNRKAGQPTVAPVSSPDQMAVPEKTAPAPPMQSASSQPSTQQPSPDRRIDTPDMSADKTPDWAIESVKKSHALDRFTTVDALVNKWTKENTDKLKPIGWIARKVDEQVYLVTFTATDGVTPTGFYFDISSETGEIRNIANHPDLQKKYGIKGN